MFSNHFLDNSFFFNIKAVCVVCVCVGFPHFFIRWNDETIRSKKRFYFLSVSLNFQLSSHSSHFCFDFAKGKKSLRKVFLFLSFLEEKNLNFFLFYEVIKNRIESLSRQPVIWNWEEITWVSLIDFAVEASWYKWNRGFLRIDDQRKSFNLVGLWGLHRKFTEIICNKLTAFNFTSLISLYTSLTSALNFNCS